MKISGAQTVSAALMVSIALMGCAPVVGKPAPPLVADPNPLCSEPQEIVPEELDSFPGCDLAGFTVRIGETGGAVVPTAGEGVESEAVGSDGASLEFSLTNFGEDGVVLSVRSDEATEVWGPSTARDRLAEDSGT
ncbi:hypothetical protein [Oerskovia turbata]